MGIYLFDQYTLLHFAVGIIMYFWGISLQKLVILHIIFEYLENSQVGMNLITKYVSVWPGGKHKPDTLINSIGDILGSMLGWIVAYALDKIGSKYKWYHIHIK